jgi:hypothetical protein
VRNIEPFKEKEPPMSLSKDDREMIINLLNQLSGRILTEIGATGRTLSTFLKQRDFKWEDLIIQPGEAKELLINDDNEEKLLNTCARHLDTPNLTEWENDFIQSNIKKHKEYGYLRPKQRQRLDEIVRKLQRLGVWEGETIETAK